MKRERRSENDAARSAGGRERVQRRPRASRHDARAPAKTSARAPARPRQREPETRQTPKARAERRPGADARPARRRPAAQQTARPRGRTGQRSAHALEQWHPSPRQITACADDPPSSKSFHQKRGTVHTHKSYHLRTNRPIPSHQSRPLGECSRGFLGCESARHKNFEVCWHRRALSRHRWLHRCKTAGDARSKPEGHLSNDPPWGQHPAVLGYRNYPTSDTRNLCCKKRRLR